MPSVTSTLTECQKMLQFAEVYHISRSLSHRTSKRCSFYQNTVCQFLFRIFGKSRNAAIISTRRQRTTRRHRLKTDVRVRIKRAGSSKVKRHKHCSGCQEIYYLRNKNCSQKQDWKQTAEKAGKRDTCMVCLVCITCNRTQKHRA